MDASDCHHGAVRDLAWLVTSPGLVAGGGRGAHTVDDGWLARAHAERLGWLAALDRDPADLEAWLAHHHTGSQLGHYAEILLAFWLDRWKRCGRVRRSVQVRESGRTLGEFDLLWADRRDGVLRHWELAVKFYLRCEPSTSTAAWIGPNPDDHLAAKLDTVFTRQLALARCPEARPVLARLFPGYDPGRVRSQAVLKGYLCYPAAEWPEPRHLPRGLSGDHAMGWWLHRRELDGLPRKARDSRYVDLAKREWLGPAVRERHAPDVLAHGEMRAHLERHFRRHLRAVLVAELRPGLDGRWHERSRGFVVHDAWPEVVGPRAGR